MLIHSASQLLTLTQEPQRGHNLGELNIINDGAVLIRDGLIAAVGTTPELRAQYPHELTLDAGLHVVMPGFVDPHTHLVWAGDRAAEFEMKLQGMSYLNILAGGGGILSTVRATREASLDTLLAETRPRLQTMFTHGTTTAEAKTGYGLELTTELRLLQAILTLDAEGPLELVPTFLGAHAVPPEYKDNPDGYTDLLCNEMLPAVKAWFQNQFTNLPLPNLPIPATPIPALPLPNLPIPNLPIPNLPFIDVFCETGAFSLAQARRILETARSLGFPLKIHADEFDNLGGATLAAELGAVSADHLVKISPTDMRALAASQSVAVALPCTPFGLAETEYTPVRELLEAGAILALASDLNPGTAWCGNMQFAIALACRYLQLTPAQAIAAATINAAAAIGRAGQVGSITPGKQADLLILSVSDYRHLGYRFGTNLVSTVIKHGKIYRVYQVI